MINAKSIFGLLILLFCACSQTQKKPEGLIPRDQMASILTDIHIAEAAATYKTIAGDSLVKFVLAQDEHIFLKHRTTKTEFMKSYRFYADDPKVLNEIYAEVINEISKKQAGG